MGRSPLMKLATAMVTCLVLLRLYASVAAGLISPHQALALLGGLIAALLIFMFITRKIMRNKRNRP